MILDIIQNCQEALTMAKNTTERTRDFMRYFNSDYGWFEDLTGVAASKWRDLDRGKTKAVTAEMIDAFGRSWPEYVYWLVTGVPSARRGQCAPTDYLDLTYGTVRVLEPGTRRFWRDEQGVLCPGEISSGQPEASTKHEVAIAAGFLYFSAVVNEAEAAILAEKFQQQFLAPLKAGEETSIALGDLKSWVNQFPLHL